MRPAAPGCWARRRQARSDSFSIVAPTASQVLGAQPVEIRITLDASAQVRFQPNVAFRFWYDDGGQWAWWWEVDDVVLAPGAKTIPAAAGLEPPPGGAVTGAVIRGIPCARSARAAATACGPPEPMPRMPSLASVT